MVAPALLIAGGAAAGLLGSKNSGKPTTTNSSSYVTPYGGSQGLDDLLDLQKWGFGHALTNAQYGPNELQDNIYNSLLNGTAGGGWSPGSVRGGEGIGAEWYGFGGGPDLPEAVGMSPDQIANFTPAYTAGLQERADGQYLGHNPYIDSLISGTRDDAIRSFRETELPGITSDFAGHGRSGSHAMGGALARANAEFQDDLNNRTSAIRYQDYNDEQNRMLQALGLMSSETQGARGLLGGLRNADLSSATSIRNTNTQANVARYGADLNASIAAANLNQQADIAGNQFGLAGAQQEWARLLGSYQLGESYNNATNQGALLPLNIIQQFSSMYTPLLHSFGTHYGQNEVYQPEIDPWAAAAQGALGGGLAAYGSGAGTGSKG